MTVRQARAAALLSLLVAEGIEMEIDEFGDLLPGWTRAEIARAVDDLAEAGTVHVDGCQGYVTVYAAELDVPA